MTFDFTHYYPRQGKDAIALDKAKEFLGMAIDQPREGFDFIPLWIADMNFPTAPAVTKAIKKRMDHPIYGYFLPSDDYYQAIIDWQAKHHLVTDLKSEYIGFENGVHGSIVSCVELFSRPGEGIFLHTPFYLGFTADIQGLGRQAIYSELRRDDADVYRINFEDMESKIAESHCHLAILCSPHNPTGRVWERWELEKMMAIFEKYQVTVISDEIWADITYGDHQHIPSHTVSDWARENTISIYAPSKTFNLAGLVGSYHVIYNKALRDRVRHYSNNTHYNKPNVLSIHALIGAYSHEGDEWAQALLVELEKNTTYLAEFLNQFKGIVATKPQGTYLVFADFSTYCHIHGVTIEEIIKKGYDVGVGWQSGALFGGKCHIRFNCALPFKKLVEVCERLETYVLKK